MSLAETMMSDLLHKNRLAPTRDKHAARAVRIPVSYIADWSVRADAKQGAHIELTLDGVPLESLMVLINELKAAAPVA